MYPKTLNNIINYLSKLPGIGKTSAERMALQLFTNFKDEELLDFSKNIKELKQNVKYCKVCNNLTQGDICDVCANDKRDKKVIMVVRECKDLYLIEQMNKYNGVYHVLNGLIDISRGKTHKDIEVNTLLNRLQDDSEVILALDTTIEGEITSTYLKKVINLQNPKVSITRISYGIPLNIDLKYVDVNTLLMSIEKRIKY
jgi:recombination protein RecR